MSQAILTGISKPLIAALVAYLAASHVLFDSATWNIIITSLVAAGLAAWSGLQHRQASMIANVDYIAKQKNSPVKAIIMESTPEGAAIANSLSGMTTLIAGTTAARSASEIGSA